MLLLVIGLFHVAQSAFDLNSSQSPKGGRQFSLFSIVRFPNDACSSSSSNFPVGNCQTSSECSTNGGTAQGNCAAGFGVCCVFTESTCGSSFSNNCTYVTNPGFPSLYTTTGTCIFTVKKSESDICQLRLDFLTMAISASTSVLGCCGSGCTVASDSLTVAGQTSWNPPVICGINTGLHMYVPVGRSSSDTATLTFYQTSSSNNYNIKVSQISCFSKWRSPDDCLQYFTGTTGTVTSYNWAGGQYLTSQSYSNCIRQEKGYCSIQWKGVTSTSPNPFELTNAAIADSAENTLAACIQSFVYIPACDFTPGTSSDNVLNEFCGEAFGVDAGTVASVCTSTKLPFRAGVFSDTNAKDGKTAGEAVDGFSLEYTQVGC